MGEGQGHPTLGTSPAYDGPICPWNRFWLSSPDRDPSSLGRTLLPRTLPALAQPGPPSPDTHASQSTSTCLSRHSRALEPKLQQELCLRLQKRPSAGTRACPEHRLHKCYSQGRSLEFTEIHIFCLHKMGQSPLLFLRQSTEGSGTVPLREAGVSAPAYRWKN